MHFNSFVLFCYYDLWICLNSQTIVISSSGNFAHLFQLRAKYLPRAAKFSPAFSSFF